ncbi:hypothetical protein H4R34_003905 [Dimargaris verticillata]|uniref:UFSP1/2/DUB catalytic domain-containing protein n=1 Tax=Dimargaris verticillata TaxID=2761393 RepID=A0A9W8E8M4_9FUNG|nr:hypothetical protein H4R34_003905 [Dimargaris verticillata]
MHSCPICQTDLVGRSLESATRHVESHWTIDLTQDSTPAPAQPARTLSHIYDALSVQVAGMLPPQRIWLCAPHVECTSSTRRDRHWTCGYRNTQTLLSALIPQDPQLAARLQRCVPTIRQLQQALELAWRQGHDPVGASQLGHRVVNTQKWIGPTEVYCILQALQVNAQLIDFHRPTGSQGSHPALVRFVERYYTGQLPILPHHGESALALLNSPCLTTPLHDTTLPIQWTNLPPLYWQHAGHSRVIIGVEYVNTAATHLLVYDPEVPIERYHQSLTAADALLALVRVPIAQLAAHQQYQLLMVWSDADPPSPSAVSGDLRGFRLCRVP